LFGEKTDIGLKGSLIIGHKRDLQGFGTNLEDGLKSRLPVFDGHIPENIKGR